MQARHEGEDLGAPGATGKDLAVFASGSEVSGRFLLDGFYRRETGVSEATLLGRIGIVSLGDSIDDPIVRRRFGGMILWILLGSARGVVGDAASAIARAYVRRS